MTSLADPPSQNSQRETQPHYSAERSQEGAGKRVKRRKDGVESAMEEENTEGWDDSPTDIFFWVTLSPISEQWNKKTNAGSVVGG